MNAAFGMRLSELSEHPHHRQRVAPLACRQSAMMVLMFWSVLQAFVNSAAGRQSNLPVCRPTIACCSNLIFPPMHALHESRTQVPAKAVIGCVVKTSKQPKPPAAPKRGHRSSPACSVFAPAQFGTAALVFSCARYLGGSLDCPPLWSWLLQVACPRPRPYRSSNDATSSR